MAISAASGTWTVGDNWPWPRMFVTDYYVLAIAVNGTNLSLYELINDSDAWTATEVAELGAIANVYSISVASFEKYYLVAVKENAFTRLIARKPLASAGLTATEEISSSVMPHCTAICNYKNQIIMGGIYSNDTKWQSLGSCAVAYSGIGNNVFDPESDPSSGFLKMPWDIESSGKVYQIYKLQNDVIVYGNGGIERLTPFGNEQATGFGQDTIWSTGLLAANCAGGSIIGHAFIDQNYDLCVMTDKVEVLGYRRYMENLTAADIIISYEPKKQYFYISDGNLSYVLSKGGLNSTHMCPTSVSCYNNNICGFYLNTNQPYFQLTTTEFDFGIQGLKSLESIETGINYITDTEQELPAVWGDFGDADQDFYAKLYTRYSYKEDYINLDWMRLNERGILQRRITGRSFKISLRALYDTDAEINVAPIKVNLQYPDNRNIRSQKSGY